MDSLVAAMLTAAAAEEHAKRVPPRARWGVRAGLLERGRRSRRAMTKLMWDFWHQPDPEVCADVRPA